MSWIRRQPLPARHTPFDIETSCNINGRHFELTFVCAHRGHWSGSGHFVSYARNGKAWTYLDDGYCKLIAICKYSRLIIVICLFI